MMFQYVYWIYFLVMEKEGKKRAPEKSKQVP